MNLTEITPGKIKFPFSLDTRPGPAYLRVAAPTRFAAGFSLRPGGVSRGPYAEANMSFAVGDEAEKVAANRKSLMAGVGGGRGFSRLVSVKQVHGRRCLVVDEETLAAVDNFDSIEADAMATDRPGLLLAIQTADCLPLIMISERPRAVAVVHAGWRGLEKGVASGTVACLGDSFGVVPAALKVYAGPAIGPCCFEVGPEVVAAFRKKSWLAGVGGWHRPTSRGGCLDLVAIQRAELLAAGVERDNFFALNLCTSCHDFCFSYRRDRGITGRQLAVAGIIQ